MTALLGTAVLLWQLASGPVSGDGAISTTGVVSATVQDAPRHDPSVRPMDDSPASDDGERGASMPDTATVVTGTATWCAPTPRYCQSWGGDAHKGAVRSFRYGDKPYNVKVCHAGRCTRVTVVSYCACGNTLIDLSPAAFRELAPLSRGRISVTVERVGRVFLPQTSTEVIP